MKSLFLRIVLALSLGLFPAIVCMASDEPPPAQSDAFAKDQLEQLVAPIALYPDALLTQILMASTYPLEVIEANRFVTRNPELNGEALDSALLEEDWDASVKSLTALPEVLKNMSDNLDWTQDLGDAFLGQRNELLDTVQRMRGLALEAGNLQTTEQQVVTREPDNIIVIESPEPEVIYVPTYSSTVVYGSTWGYPSYYYPPMYYPPPPGYGLITFGFGVAMGAAIWGDCHWGWGNNEINIDIDRYNDFDRNTNINADRDRIQSSGQGGQANWQHDPSHRKGVNYRSPEVAQRNGAAAGSTRVTQSQARGYTSGASGSPAAARSAQADRDMAGRSGQYDRNSAYSGSYSPSADRMSSSRGASSRGTSSYGGASRAAPRGGARRR